jgi:hypothetical protein
VLSLLIELVDRALRNDNDNDNVNDSDNTNNNNINNNSASTDSEHASTTPPRATFSAITPNSSRHYFIVEVLHLLDDTTKGNGLPPSLLDSIISTLCFAVNIESQAAWFVMRTIISNDTMTAMRAILSLLDKMLRSTNNAENLVICRGVIFTLGMALWGSGRIPSIRIYWVDALEKLAENTGNKTPISIAFEMALSIHRLIRKYGSDVHMNEMSPLIQIISNLLFW